MGPMEEAPDAVEPQAPAGLQAAPGCGAEERGRAWKSVCPQCGTKAPRERGVPCFQQKCPKCGSTMARA